MRLSCDLGGHSEGSIRPECDDPVTAERNKITVKRIGMLLPAASGYAKYRPHLWSVGQFINQ